MRTKNAYCSARRRAQRIASYTLSDNRYWSMWLKIAEMCLGEGIEPEEYIEVLFNSMKPWPHINSLASGKSLSRYYENAASTLGARRMDFDLQKQALVKLVKELEQDSREVLLDSRNNFDALFSFTAALACGHADLAQGWYSPALEKYLSSVHYDKIYGDAIPESFRQRRRSLKEG